MVVIAIRNWHCLLREWPLSAHTTRQSRCQFSLSYEFLLDVLVFKPYCSLQLKKWIGSKSLWEFCFCAVPLLEKYAVACICEFVLYELYPWGVPELSCWSAFFLEKYAVAYIYENLCCLDSDHKVYNWIGRCPWCNGYHGRKWTRRCEFKS